MYPLFGSVHASFSSIVTAERQSFCDEMIAFPSAVVQSARVCYPLLLDAGTLCSKTKRLVRQKSNSARRLEQLFRALRAARHLLVERIARTVL